MPRTRATRQRIAAIAATADYNPHEADNARRMLEAMPETRLEVISGDIKDEWGKGIEAQFAIGRLLSEARSLMPGVENDIAFGEWFKSQDFPFSQQQARRLRYGAEHEAEVRAFIAATTSTRGPDMSVPTAVEYMKRRAKIVAQLAEGTYVEPTTSAYGAFEKAAKDLWDAMPQLPNDELAGVAQLVGSLVDRYQTVRGSR